MYPCFQGYMRFVSLFFPLIRPHKVIHDQLLRRNVYQVSKHEIFALQIHMTTLPSRFVSTVVPLQTMSEKQNQSVFLYRLASCALLLLQHHKRHRKLGQLVIWDQNVQVLWKTTVSFLTAEMTLALSDPNSILCLDGEEHTVVLALKVDVVKIYCSTSIDLGMISIL